LGKVRSFIKILARIGMLVFGGFVVFAGIAKMLYPMDISDSLRGVSWIAGGSTMILIGLALVMIGSVEIRKRKEEPIGTVAPAVATARIFCPSCGAENKPEAKFCINCGTSLK